MINYTIDMNDPLTHYFDVQMEIEGYRTNSDFIDVKLPVWRPGRYLVLEFAAGLQNFSAEDGNGNRLRWEKRNKFTWRIHINASPRVKLSYKMYANEFDLRTRGLDAFHAFINPAAVFMFVDELRYEPVTLKVIPYKEWHNISTGLENIGNNIFAAPGYDVFADSPLEIGNHKDYEFDVGGKKHIISFFGTADININKIIDDFKIIIQKNFTFWGGTPYEKYVFIVHCTPVSGGGTEHINSTVVGVKPLAFESEEGYKSFLRLISHEFFHTWNVKQLKPAGLSPYNYTEENYTSELWIAEGGTTYYDGLILTQCGLMNESEFYEEIARAADDEQDRPGYRVQSVAESSFDAWIKFWRRTPNAYFSESDYYLMGSYVCMVLDLEIRNSSENRYSLDDVLRTMFEKFPLDKKGYTNRDFQKVCEKFAGKELNSFFEGHVFGTKPIDWEKYLSFAGLKIVRKEVPGQPVAGLFCGKSGDKIVVTSVLHGSPADRSGIIKGDEIIACDGLRSSFEETEKKIKSASSGDRFLFTVSRANKIMNFTLTLEKFNADKYSIEKISDPSDLQKAIYEKWLNVKW